MNKYFVIVTEPCKEDPISEHFKFLLELPKKFEDIPRVIEVHCCSKMDGSNHKFHFEIVSTDSIDYELKRQKLDFFTAQ